MADYENKFRKKALGNVLSRRKAMRSNVLSAEEKRVSSLPQGRNFKVIEKHLEYLEKQLPKHREAFDEAFRMSLGGLPIQDRDKLINILAPTEALESNLRDAIKTPGYTGISFREYLKNAISGSSGRALQHSTLLMRFIATQHGMNRPLRSEIDAGGMPVISKVSDWFTGQGKTRGVQLNSNRAIGAITGIGGGWDKGLISQLGEFTRIMGKEVGVGVQFTELTGSEGVKQLQAQFKYGGRDISFKIPQMQTDVQGSYKTQIGYTGDNLNVRRVYRPFTLLDEGGAKMGQKVRADIFAMGELLGHKMGGKVVGGGEIIEGLRTKTLSGAQAVGAFKNLSSIFIEGELPGGSHYAITPAQRRVETIMGQTTKIVQMGLAGAVDELGIPQLSRSPGIGDLVKFMEGNKGYYSDVGSSKLGQGILSTMDHAGFQLLGRAEVEHANLQQGIRKSTPSAQALTAAYGELSKDKLTTATKNLKEAQKFIRQNLSSSLLPGGDKGSRSLTERTQSQAQKIAAVHQKVNTNGAFRISGDEQSTLLRMVRRKGVNKYDLMRSMEFGRGAGLKDARNLAKAILEAPQKVVGSKFRGFALTSATKEERQLTGFAEKMQKTGKFRTTTTMQRLLKKHAGVLQAGAYYIDPSITSALGSGSFVGAPQMRELLKAEVSGSFKLDYMRDDGLFSVRGGKVSIDRNVLKSREKFFIGYSETGKAKYVTDAMLESGEMTLSARLVGPKDNLKLHVDYTRVLDPEELTKIHGDLKAGGAILPSNRAFENARDLISSQVNNTVGARTLRTQRFQADLITLADHMAGGKKSQLHNRQMLTAMQMHHVAHMDAMKSSGLGRYEQSLTESSKPLLEDLDKFRRNIQGKGLEGERAIMAHKRGTERLLKYFFETGIGLENELRGAGHAGMLKDVSRSYLNPRNFASIFGLTQTHFGGTSFGKKIEGSSDIIMANVLSQKIGGVSIEETLKSFGYKPEDYMKGAKSGVAAGMIRVAVGDPMSQQGAGKMATLEPRFYDVFDNVHFGGSSKEIAEDFATRLRSFDLSPAGKNKLGVHQELQKTLESLQGLRKPSSPTDVINLDLKHRETGDILDELDRHSRAAAKEGRDLYAKIGEHTVYVPHEDTPGMGIKTQDVGGKEIPTQAEIRKHFNKFITGTKTGEMGAKNTFIEGVMTDWAIEGKGMGSVERNRLPGSFFLTAGTAPVTKGDKLTQAGLESMDDLFTLKITKKYAKQMKEDLIQTGLYNEGEIKRMFSQLEKGGRMAGGVFRHPAIGPYSFQKVFLQLANSNLEGPTVYVPEIRNEKINFSILDEMKGNLRQGIRKSALVTLGPMVGLAGDFDFDVLGIAAFRPDIEKSVAKELGGRAFGRGGISGDSAYNKAYIQHQIRFQLLESAGEKMVAGTGEEYLNILQAKRHASAQSNIGLISSHLTQAKRAASSYLSGENLANIQILAEWIEQKPIGFKHVDPDKIERLLGNMTDAFRRGRAEDLKTSIKEFLKPQGIATQSVQLDPGTIRQLEQQYGVKLDSELKSLNLNKTIDELAYALEKGQQGLFKNINVHRGRSNAASVERELLNMWRDKHAGAAGKVMGNVDQVFSNILGELGHSPIANHKGIAALAAIGGLAALSGMNSQPKEMVGPGKNLTANQKIRMNQRKAHKRMVGQDVRPTRAPIGNPMGPNLLSQRRAMIASHPVPTNKFAVRARANHPDDIGIISEQFQQFAVNGGSVNISNSSRSIKNPYGEMNKLY